MVNWRKTFTCNNQRGLQYKEVLLFPGVLPYKRSSLFQQLKLNMLQFQNLQKR